jgi:hypothetical protein
MSQQLLDSENNSFRSNKKCVKSDASLGYLMMAPFFKERYGAMSTYAEIKIASTTNKQTP